MTIVRRLVIAKVGDLKAGASMSFRYGIRNGILWNDGGTLKAYVNQCTHMGGPVALADGGRVFRCGWHQAEFDPHTGEAIHGEAPEGTRLQVIPITIENNQVTVTLELSSDAFS